MEEINITYAGQNTHLSYARPVILRVLEKIGQEMVRLGIIEACQAKTVYNETDRFELRSLRTKKRRLLKNKLVDGVRLIKIHTKRDYYDKEQRWLYYETGIISVIEIYDKRTEAILSKVLPIYYDRFKIIDKHQPEFIKCYNDSDDEAFLVPITVGYERSRVVEGYAFSEGLQSVNQ